MPEPATSNVSESGRSLRPDFPVRTARSASTIAEGTFSMKDVVIVGGGLAGLAAGWRLRHWDTVLLESGSRVGGRIRSERRGRYWLNWGGHVFAGLGTCTDALLTEVGITTAQVPGSLAGLAMNGKLLLKGRVETYPFRVPMP